MSLIKFSVGLLFCFSSHIAAAAEKPNVIILTADQLRASSVGYNGDTKAMTPNLDQLAKQGVNLTNYVVNTPVCSAFRATLMTGKHASSAGLIVNEIRINPNQDCLAHVLTASGYETAHIGKWHLWAAQAGHHQDVQNAFIPPGPYRLGFDGYFAAYNFNHNNYRAYYFEDTPQRKQIAGHGTEHFTDLAIKFMKEKAPLDKPFFLNVAFSPPHDPWTKENVPPGWLEKFDNVKFELPKTWTDKPDPRMDRNTDPKKWLKRWKPNLPEYMRIYYAMTAHLDWNIGRILKALDETGEADNTIVIFTSDHGEQFGHNSRVYKMTFYDQSARVPILIRWPKHIAAGSKNDMCMSAVDLMPTLLGLVGSKVPAAVEGMNLSNPLQDKPGPVPEFALLQGMGHTFLWIDGIEWRAIRNKQYTYARYKSDGKELLFDNLNDPQQAHDLAAVPKHLATLEALRGKMADKMNQLNDNFELCTWYRDHWLENRVILRGAQGKFERTTGPNVEVDTEYSPVTEEVK
ncbi:MAG: hypothetical protein COA78_19850 [Blastopirellula sp.]|nr:MAG: hypothetical protein COA78_19850 [Blastopirellula sp.]